MYIKVATVRVKRKGDKREKVYKYVRVVDRGGYLSDHYQREKVIATLGTLSEVFYSRSVLIDGLKRLSIE